MGLIILNFQFNSLLVLVLYTSSIICLSLTEAKLCKNEERAALLQFKNHFSINESSDYCLMPRTWKEDDEDCCVWDGVSCDDVTGHVIDLDLSYSCLHGTIPPNSSLFNLVHLQSLWLEGNDFSNSHISPLFGHFKDMKYLNLEGSEFSGVVPNEIFELPKLVMLDLRDNHRLTGDISSLNATTLRKMDLSGTSFIGKLPDSIGKFKSLLVLELAYCNFSGSIPTSLGNLTDLYSLTLEGNQFNGKVPSSFSNLQNMEYLDLADNKLQGHIPHSLVNMTKLNSLFCGGNALSGQLPFKLFNLSKLSELDLSGNQLTGTIDFNMLTKLHNLECLSLSNNDLSLTTTNSNILSAFPHLYFLSLSSCNISINMLAYLNAQSNLWYVDLSNNKIDKTLHQSICSLHSLAELDLSNNQLVGLIPACLGKFTRSLKVLNLQNNNFHGTIPQSIGYANKLETLDLSNNGLQGVLPRSLVYCKLLQFLNLGGNRLTDSFPIWLVNLPLLKVLVLRDNKFYGTITEKLKRKPRSFVNLHIIDVSNNDLMGTIPSKYFERWTTMTIIGKNASESIYMNTRNFSYFYSVNVMNKGLFLHYARILMTVKIVDFSCNMFHGSIPLSVGKLKGIQVLNFSGNSFTGPIPFSLGNLTNLESLDLSNNKLSGEIPWELGGLTFLEFLNVSQNNLTGVIPRGGQLNTFSNTSYEGNPGLCGLPVSKLCRSPDIPNSSSQESHGFKFKVDDFGWEVVLIGYGCGLVLGLVIGCCIIRRKEDWLERTFRLKMLSMGKRSKNQRS